MKLNLINIDSKHMARFVPPALLWTLGMVASDGSTLLNAPVTLRISILIVCSAAACWGLMNIRDSNAEESPITRSEYDDIFAEMRMRNWWRYPSEKRLSEFLAIHKEINATIRLELDTLNSGLRIRP